MATLVELGPGPVNETERMVVRRLVDGLPHYYRVFPNLSFRDRKNGHAYEYDVVVLTGHAVYVIEIKGWRGPIRAVNRRDWQLRSGRFTANPLPLNDQKARVLKSVLEPVPLVRKSEPIRPPYVHAILVASDDADFDVFLEDAPYCLRASEVCAYVADPARLPVHAIPDLYQGSMRKLADAVSGALTARPVRPRRFGSYVVHSTVLQTDESATYLAKHAEFDDGRLYRIRTHAVSAYLFSKEERERRLTMLKRSAEALHRIGDHPNVVSLREYGDTDDGFFEVTDWSDAGTLATALALGAMAKLPLERRLAVLTGIARGIAAAHASGVHHRNLRPEAVLLGLDGLPGVGELELAFIEKAEHTVYGPDAIVPLDPHPYRAPELRDPHDYEVFDNTDLYALGRIGYDLFLGFQPEEGERPPLVLDAPFGPALAALIARLAADDASERPASAAEVVAELEALARPRSDRPPGPKRCYEPEDRIGDNRVLELVARSETSQVYRVANEVLEETLVLKLAAEGADPDGPLREYRALDRVRHAHVVTPRWRDRLPPDAAGVRRAYLLLEDLGRQSLAARLERGPLPPDEALSVFEKLASALAAVHRAGLIHRDVKPENIALAARGPVLADFGIAAPIEEAGEAPVGSRRYQPPDLGEEGWDPSADVFALGCVAFSCFTGRRPFGDGAPSGMPDLDAVDGPLRKVLQGALAPRRADRYPDGEALALALERMKASHVDRAAEVEPTPEPRAATVHPALVDEAEARPWSAAWFEALTLSEAPSRFVFDALPLREGSFVAIEGALFDLELPLPEVFPSFYDELLTPSPPLDAETLPEDAAPIARADGELVVVLDGITIAEWERARAAMAPRRESSYVWRTGPIDPRSTSERAAALEGVLVGVEPRWAETPSDAARAIAGGASCVAVTLPTGQRDDELAALLETRAHAIDTVMAAARALPRAIVTTTLGGVYLGHGLRRDVGEGAGSRGDRVRQAWQSAFAHGRFGDTPPRIEGPRARAWRAAGRFTFVAGRAAWPDPPGAPRIATGGASVGERLLPLFRYEAP